VPAFLFRVFYLGLFVFIPYLFLSFLFVICHGRNVLFIVLDNCRFDRPNR
jgi:hypothetical protein